MRKKCSRCDARCCKEIAICFGRAVSKDVIRWANYHEKCRFIKDNGYYWLAIRLRCQRLRNNRCSIYKTRPQLCREYYCENKGILRPVY